MAAREAQKTCFAKCYLVIEAKKTRLPIIQASKDWKELIKRERQIGHC